MNNESDYIDITKMTEKEINNIKRPYKYEEDYDPKSKPDPEKYEYYIDTYNKSLHKRNKLTNEWYEFVIRSEEGKLLKDWLKEKPIERELIEIKDINKVEKYIEDNFYDILFVEGESNINIEDYI